jgi:hypothetical protein
VIREGLVWLNTLASKTVWGTILLKTIWQDFYDSF